MKRFVAAVLLVTVFSCGTSEVSLCGDGEELSAEGEGVCLYRSELIEEGFQCPPERSVRTDLDDGAVVCSRAETLSDGIEELLEARGHEDPTQGTSWSLEVTDPPSVNNAVPPDAERWVLGTLIDVDQTAEEDEEVPLENARICIMDAEPESCATTDVRGQFALPIATETEYALTAERDGYYPTILPIPPLPASPQAAGSPNLVLMGWGMTSVDAETGMLTSAGVTQDPSLGLLSTCIEGEGVVATLEPGDFQGWYPDETALVRSPSGTTRAHGAVRFPNLPAGLYTVSMASDDLDCVASGWQGAAEHTIRVPIRAGFMTSPLTIICR